MAIANLPWTTSLGCETHLATLVSSTLCHVTRPKAAERHTNTTGPRHPPHPVAGPSYDWFSAKLHEKRKYISIRLSVGKTKWSAPHSIRLETKIESVGQKILLFQTGNVSSFTFWVSETYLTTQGSWPFIFTILRRWVASLTTCEDSSYILAEVRTWDLTELPALTTRSAKWLASNGWCNTVQMSMKHQWNDD